MKSLLFAGLLCACVDPGVSEGTAVQKATTAFANDQAAFTFFVRKGLTSFQSAGIVGNLDQESGVDPTIAQYGGGPGRGIAQWSVGDRWDSASNDNVVWYAGTKGESPTSLDLQLEFIWYELTQIGYGYSDLTASTNLNDATVAFMSEYEICGTCDASQRLAYADDVLNAYGAVAYGASYVSQSWPLATDPLVIHCGETVAATITLNNTGTMPWTSETQLGTTEPRDRNSMFAGADWLAANRPAAISGTVAPGANGTFTFAFHGPTGAACVPGTYHEHFGVTQQGVGWFSDNNMGGPADDQLEAQLQLMPADPSQLPNDPTRPGDPTQPAPGHNSAGGCNAGHGASGSCLPLIAALALRRRRR
jgi:hypothetical protein